MSYSLGSVYNIAKELKLVPKKPGIKPLITFKQKEKRVEFCTEKRLKKSYWKKVLIIDEKLFIFNKIPRHQ